MTQEFNHDEFLAIVGQTDQQQYADTNEEVRNPATGRIIKGGDGADDGLNVQFSTEAVLNKLESYRAKRNVYTDMEFISVRAPGQNLTSIHTPVTEYYKWRFPVDYAAFKRGQAEVVTGTPLAMWPLISPSQMKDLEHSGIRTIEQIANLSDSAAPAMRGFYTLKAGAQQFLDNARDTQAASRLQAQLDQANAQNQATVAMLQQQMADLMALVKAKDADEAVPESEDGEPVKMRFGKPVKAK
jgi:hypothetical protein